MLFTKLLDKPGSAHPRAHTHSHLPDFRTGLGEGVGAQVVGVLMG